MKPKTKKSNEGVFKVVQLTPQTVTFHRPQPRLANQILESHRRHCNTEKLLLLVNVKKTRDNRESTIFSKIRSITVQNK